MAKVGVPTVEEKMHEEPTSAPLTLGSEVKSRVGIESQVPGQSQGLGSVRGRVSSIRSVPESRVRVEIVSQVPSRDRVWVPSPVLGFEMRSRVPSRYGDSSS
ncbi:hypothetical protein HAX54_007143 [Datura stramonium]|uniref:Uncharacterized protein n=1 Tax=Datura stramonium TaxID=4076 RepID=A0ABS8TC62_DATST|nr:hypothetical protein [Datura stramonium]